MTSTGRARPLRRDAQRNRDLIAHHAREVFGTKGIDAPLDEIARTAGVSIGTLYNRFPSRVELVEAAFLPEVERLVSEAERASDADEPWAGFSTFVWTMCELQVADRGLTDVCGRAIDDATGLAEAKRRAGEAIERIVRRAKSSGDLRADFSSEDLAFATGAVAGMAHQNDTDAWRRHVTYLLDGFRADRANP